jgi:hypothetical protein
VSGCCGGSKDATTTTTTTTTEETLTTQSPDAHNGESQCVHVPKEFADKLNVVFSDDSLLLVVGGISSNVALLVDLEGSNSTCHVPGKMPRAFESAIGPPIFESC